MIAFSVLAGEEVKFRESGAKAVVKNLEGQHSLATVDVLVTSWRVVFLSGPALCPLPPVPLAAIETVQIEQLVGRSKTDVVTQLELVCRDLLVVTLLFASAVSAKAALALLSSHRDFSQRFPLVHFKAAGALPCRFGRYVPEADFARMGLPNAHYALNTTCNRGFVLCASYPETLCVPRGFPDDALFRSAAFRSKRRFPVLVWHSPRGGGCLLRSSQPHVGVGRARCEEDERLLRAASACGVASTVLLIVDARPRINALANQATTSGGSENPAFYPFAMLLFGGIENIHEVRASFERLQAVVTSKSDDSADFDKRLRATGWQKHLHTILSCARSLADWLVDGKTALLHCSDGWDRTPQVASLSQLMLDPFYRTVEGFAVLVEKDWIHYGHMWQWRFGQVQGDDRAKERAPVFLQFLACVAQLLVQFPCSFEFNSNFLVGLARASVSGLSGSFAANDPHERSELRLDETTHSVWETFLDEARGHVRSEFVNGLFDGQLIAFLAWDPHFARMSLWHDMYWWPRDWFRLRHAPGVQVQARLEALSEEHERRVSALTERLGTLSQANPDLAALERALAAERQRADSLWQRLEREAVEAAMEAVYAAGWRELRDPMADSFGEGPLSARGGRRVALEDAASAPSQPQVDELVLVSNSVPPPPVSSGMWVPDSLVQSCTSCSAKFTWTVRKHHCRACGIVVCHACSTHRMLLNGVVVRVCDGCFTKRFLS